MADRLYLGTRKGLFTLEHRGGKWETTNVAFLGDPVSMLLEDPRDGTLFASLALGHFGVKVRRSRDDGASWEETPSPIYPEGAKLGVNPDPDATGQEAKPASLSEIWCLESAGDDRPGGLWAGTIPGGLFYSPDQGDSWTLNEPLWNQDARQQWFGGGKDDPGIHSIVVDPRDSDHVTVGVSCGGVWVTRDGGQSWQCGADGMRAEYMPPDRAYDPHIQDPHRLVSCPAAPDHFWAQHHNGVFRSTNDCGEWSEIESIEPAGFGFAVAVHPEDPQTAWFAPGVKDECRVPVDAKVVVSRTRDGGRTFDVIGAGLPDPGYDIIFRHALEVDETGSRLAMGSSTGSLWISDDAGDSWQLVSAHLPQIYCLRFGR